MTSKCWLHVVGLPWLTSGPGLKFILFSLTKVSLCSRSYGYPVNLLVFAVSVKAQMSSIEARSSMRPISSSGSGLSGSRLSSWAETSCPCFFVWVLPTKVILTWPRSYLPNTGKIPLLEQEINAIAQPSEIRWHARRTCALCSELWATLQIL